MGQKRKQIITKFKLTPFDIVTACSMQNGMCRGRAVQGSDAGREYGTGNYTMLTCTKYQKNNLRCTRFWKRGRC